MKVLLMRHGDYQAATGGLSAKGMDQVDDAAKRLLEVAKENGWSTFHVCTSPKPRAVQSARIVYDTLQQEFKNVPEPEQRREIGEDTETWQTTSLIESVSQREDAPEVLILIMHQMDIALLVLQCSNEFGERVRPEPDYGETWKIDQEGRTVNKLWPVG